MTLGISIRAKAFYCVAIFLALSSHAFSASLTAPLNKARVLKMDAPISQVVVGNPALITVSILDPYTISVTGVVSGQTNIIVLDTATETQFSADVTVPGHKMAQGNVAVIRRTASADGTYSAPLKEVLNCSSQSCTPTISPSNSDAFRTQLPNYRADLAAQAELNFPEEE